MFSGLLFCADCGEKLYYNTFKSDVRRRPYFCCSTYRLHSDECSAHFIQEPTVEKLVLEGLQRLLWYVQVFEQKFAQERFGLQEKKALTAKRRELDKAAALQHFIERARKVTRLTELTPEIIHEFIEKIVVSKPDKVDGKRYQRVDIHYNTIGLWTAPEPEEMEKLFQEHLAEQRQKTA